MSFDILNRWTQAVIFHSETAIDVGAAMKEAVAQRAHLEGADLRGLEGADLRGAYLEGADLRGAYLEGARLRGAHLEGADLRGAYLEGADLRGADLEGADLRGAYLEGADLRGADMEGADLRGAYLEGAKGISPKVLQILGSRHALIVRDYGKLSIGCMSNTLEWWKEHYAAVGRSEGYSAEEIEEYREHIASARNFMERYSLLVAPQAEVTK